MNLQEQTNRIKQMMGLNESIFVRFGLPNMDKLGEYQNSHCWYGNIQGPKEGGISVFEAEYKDGKYYVFAYGSRLKTSFEELMLGNKEVYLVDGEDSGNEGSDGDILLDPCTFKVIKTIPKHKVVQVS